MAARKKKASRKKATRKKTSGRRKGAIARLEKELPPTLAQFSRRVRTELQRLEKQLEKALKPARREAVVVLRDVSQTLGRLEGEGERRWRKLSGQARRDAVSALKRVEKAVEPPRRKSAAGRKKASSRRSA
jgi:hypothetical protein